MVINKIKVLNFRNLENLNIVNSSNIKYIIGNNGIGKSNLLEALNIFFTKASFSNNDFYDETKPIEIEISLVLNDIELGYFDDLFDIDNENIINIKAIQDSPIDRIEYYHVDTGSSISYQKIRNLPCVYYNTVNAPDELNFIKTRTSGQFLNSLIENYIDSSNIEVEDLINPLQISDMAFHLNEILRLIGFIQNNDLTVVFEKNIVDLLPRLIELKDKDNMSVNKMGSGVRYSSYIYFELLNKIMQTVQNKADSIIQTDDGRRFVSIFILLDEPEIHLHPYMQRSVINDINNIINNKDILFLDLLKKVFNIDGIFGQLIIVTHSPNIISNNYHEIIRLDYLNKKVHSYSDVSCEFTQQEEKQFLLHNNKIKEAFFAKSCILVEGPTERMALPIFAMKLGFKLDSLNVGIIDADGGESIPVLSRLLNNFGIKNVGIMDKDIYNGTYDNIYSTSYTFFEEDYVRNLIDKNRIHIIYKIISKLEERYDQIIQKNSLEKVGKKIKLYNVTMDDYKLCDALKSKDYNQKILVLTTWLFNNKKTYVSNTLAEESSVYDIPFVYIKAIEKVVLYAKR